MTKLLNALCCAMALCASIGVSASSYNYKCGPVSIEIEDLSSAYLNEFKLVISQNAKNTSEYSKQTLYPSTVELHLYPDEHSIAGTFSSKDNSIGEYSFVQYNSNFRFLNMQAESFFTIESRGGNSYAITGGKLEVRNNAGNTYTYNYCYAESDLNDRDAPVTPFEFTYTLSPLPSDDDDPEEPGITEFDTIYVSAVDYSSSYFPESHDWIVTMHDASESLYGIDIYAPESGLESGRTYSTQNGDINTDFTYAWIGREPDYALKASFTRTETDSGTEVTAEIATEGGHLYMISYKSSTPQSVENPAADGTGNSRIYGIDGRVITAPETGRIHIINGVKTLNEQY